MFSFEVMYNMDMKIGINVFAIFYKNIYMEKKLKI